MAIPVNDMSPDYPALLVANFILGESSSSRLLSRLRQKDGLSYGAGGYFEPSQYEANSALGLYAIFAPENLARVRAGFAEELARANKDGFTDAEVADAKKGVLEQRRLTRTSDSALAGGLANQAHLGRTFARSAEVDAAIATLTTAQVNDVLRKYLKPEEFAYSYAGDFGKAKK
jgi:zinc protease